MLLRLRRLGGNALLLVGASLLAVLALEVVGRFVLFKDKLYIINDVDHRMVGDGKGINSDGIRSPLEADAFGVGDFNIVLLGDSFVLGFRLDREDTISEQLQALARERHPGSRINVLNFGWVSASPLLSYRQLVDIGARYHPDLVLSCIDMTDFHDDLKYRRLLDRDGIYRLVRVAPITFLIARKILGSSDGLDGLHRRVFGFPGRRFFASRRPLEDTLPYLEPLRANIDATYAFCRDSLNAEYAVVVFPRSYQYSDRECPRNWEAREYEPLGRYVLEPFRYFDQVRKEAPYPVYSLLPAFQKTDVFPTCFEDDPHWNRDGARIAAEAIYEHLASDGYLD